MIPNYRNRSAAEIIIDKGRFESSGYIYRALSWADLAKRTKNRPAFQYAAHDARQGIEQLLFEEIVLSVGTKLDRKDYKKCVGNSTKLHKFINQLSPDREKLSLFVQAIFSIGDRSIDFVFWDNKLLMKYWGKISDFLHWSGAIDETIEDWMWVEGGISIVEEACLYIWNNQTKKEDGFMMPSDMHPEIRCLWERFKNGEIGLEDVKISAKTIILPQNRIGQQSEY